MHCLGPILAPKRALCLISGTAKVVGFVSFVLHVKIIWFFSAVHVLSLSAENLSKSQDQAKEPRGFKPFT